MDFVLCDKRKSIIAQKGHLLVLGGPGSGKTTIALHKVRRCLENLQPGQEVLFLSFSRAAIRQVLIRCKDILTPTQRRMICVQTYHSFCMDLLRSHGRLLHGRPVKFTTPGDERLQKSSFSGDWNVERTRQANQMGIYCFDLFAAGVAELIERCSALRELIGDRFPMIVVDEFQDTDDNQWRIVHALSQAAEIFCLADPEQRIFDYRDDINPRRLEILKENLEVSEFDLGSDNHRSPNSDILQFADAVLRNRAPLPVTSDVKTLRYWQNQFPPTVHAAVIFTFASLRKKGIQNPSLAVLTRSNSLVSDLSAILSEDHIYNNHPLPIVEHSVVWDAELSAASAVVVGSMLEWPNLSLEIAIPRTLRAIADFYRLKHAEGQAASAADNVRKYDEAAAKCSIGGKPRLKAANELIAVYETGLELIGDPVTDWKKARRILSDVSSLAELFREVRLVRLFRATDALASGLGQRWLEQGSYGGARDIVKKILDQERLVSAERDAESGCILMSMHKAKGKEFDGVVLVEGAFKSTFFDVRNEEPPYDRSRRILRVGLTRARALVTIVRPQDAPQLVGGY